MYDPFIQSEWQQLCARMHECAEAIARDSEERVGFLRQCDQFVGQSPPDHYRGLLQRTADASRLAVAWHSTGDADFAHDDALIDESSWESFPASDPPSFSHSHA